MQKFTIGGIQQKELAFQILLNRGIGILNTLEWMSGYLMKRQSLS